MEHAAEVGHEQDVILDGHRTTGAVHGRFKLFRIGANVVPECGRIRIVAFKITIFGHQSLQAFVRDRFLGRFRVVDQGGAHIAAFGRIDAPQVSTPFAVLWVFAHSHVDQAIVDHRRGDDVIARRRTAQHVGRIFGIAIELPEQLRLATFAGGIKAVEPAVPAAEQYLAYAT